MVHARAERTGLAEQPFTKLTESFRNVSIAAPFHPRSIEEDRMKKFALALAAIGALAVAVPSIASAETVMINRGGHHHWDRDRGARAEMRHGHGWHHDWHRHHHDRMRHHD
jgi:hypothetical protein